MPVLPLKMPVQPMWATWIQGLLIPAWMGGYPPMRGRSMPVGSNCRAPPKPQRSCSARPPMAGVILSRRTHRVQRSPMTEGAIFCLQPGVERGDWTVYLEPEGLIPAAFAHGETAFQLNGQTVAGLPSQIIPLVEEEPILCLPGRSTDTVRFRVVNSEGEGVPQVRVGLEALGELDGVSPALAITNAEGEVSVRGICPTQLFQQDSAIRAVVERELGGDLSASVAVEVRADAVTRIEIIADAANPAQIHTGDTLRYTVTAYDSNNVPVLHPVGSNEPLQLRLAIASEGHGGTLRLPGDEALGGQLLPVDAQGGCLWNSRCKAVRPQRTRFFWRFEPVTERPKRSLPSKFKRADPRRWSCPPAGLVRATVGGSGGTLTVQVLDGDDVATANGVPGVAVTLNPAPELVLDRLQGLTDAYGRFSSQIVLVDRVGVYSIDVQASQGDWRAEGRLEVQSGVGERLSLQVPASRCPCAHGQRRRRGTGPRDHPPSRDTTHHGSGPPVGQ